MAFDSPTPDSVNPDVAAATTADRSGTFFPAGGFSEQAADIDAIHRFFLTNTPRTAAADAIKKDWLVWYSNLRTLDKYFDGGTHDRARNYRNGYVRANATNEAEHAVVEQWIQQGLTAEEMSGGLRRLPPSGYYPDSLSITQKISLAVAGVALVLWLTRKK